MIFFEILKIIVICRTSGVWNSCW